MNAERLLKLASFLETVPEKGFKFVQWFRGDTCDITDCGTIGCGLGWATAVPEFRDLGLKIFKVSDGWKSGYPAIRPAEDITGQWVATCEATREIFGLTEDETEYLFTPNEDGYDDERLPEDATAKELAAHIRRFVANGC